MRYGDGGLSLSLSLSPAGVAVSENGMPFPVSAVHPGDQLKVSVYNFPPRSTVSLSLMGGTADPLALPLPIFTLHDFDDDGITTVDWTLPHETPVGKYYLQATGLGLTSFSQLIEVISEVTPKHTRRRLVI